MVVAEDDEGLNRLICKRLERHGLTPVGVLSGADAIAAVQEHPDCLLLLDYVLPDMEGRKVVAELASRGRPVPFIVMTGRGDERVAVEMMKLGARDYLAKQVNFTDLLVPVVERVLVQIATEERLTLSEKALRESEERNRLLVENSMDGVLLTAPDGRILAANREACRIFGRSEAEICRLGRNGVVDPTDPRLAPALAERERSDRFHTELTLARADGTKFPADVSSVVFTNQSGQLLTSMVVRDLTERKQTEQALRESEERFRKFSQTAPDAIVMADDEGHIDFWNEAAERMFGYTREEALGRPLPELVAPPALRERFHAGLASFARTGTGPLLGRLQQYDSMRRDGSEFPVELTMSALQLQGRWHSIGTIRDITERKRAEDALRASEEKYRVLFDNAPVGITTSKLDGTVVDFNQHAAELTGYSLEEMQGMNAGDLYPDPEVRARLVGILRSTGRISNEEVTLRRRDGSTWTALMNVLLVERAGEPMMFTTLRDITERKRAERTLRENEERFRSLAHATPDQVMLLDTDLKILFVNSPSRGLTVEQLIGTPLPRYTPPGREEEIRALLESVLRTGEPATFDTDFAAAGSTTYYESRAARIGTNRLVVVARDITQRRQAENANRERATLIDNITDAVLSTDNDLRVVSWNRGAEETYGWRADEVMGRPLPEFIRPEYLNESREQAFDTLKRTGQWRGDAVCYRKDGTRISVSMTAATLYDERQRPIGTVAVNRDITERKRAEEGLRTSEAQLSNAMEIARLGYWEYDAVEDQFTFNDHFYALFRTTAEKVGGYKMSSAEYARRFVHPEDTTMVGTEVEKAIKATDPNFSRQLEHRIIYADGGVGYISVRFFVVKDSKGRTVKTYGANQDITERKRAEDVLRTAFAEIQQLKEELEAENVYLRREIKLEHVHGDIVGESPAIKQTLALVEQVAPTDSTVLIQGETGTGKELIARSIHSLSPRKDRPLVTLSCAAMPSTLIESELFGREKGAYTGALTRQAGRFEVADKSTLFLDEVGELSPEAQTKLLRVLQEGKFERLGNSNTMTVDVRVVAATNRNLEQAVKDGRFREDLFYRLNVFPITIPPLRERREDIPVLVWTFVREFSEKMGKRIESIPKQTLEALSGHPWPGNVRGLRNIIERAMILSTGTTLHVELPGARPGVAGPTRLDEAQRSHVTQVLESTNWRIRGKGGAAEQLGLKPTTLEYRIRRLGIKRRPEDKS